MEKKKFVIKVGVWTAVIAALIIAVLGLGWGKVIEGTRFAEITKWIVTGVGVIVIIEGMVLGVIAPLWWHFKNKKRNKQE